MAAMEGGGLPGPADLIPDAGRSSSACSPVRSEPVDCPVQGYTVHKQITCMLGAGLC